MIKFNKFYIDKYKAIKDSNISVLNEPVPLIGINESGKSSALEAIARFDYRNDAIADYKKWKFLNRYMPNESVFSVSAEIFIESIEELEPILITYSDAEQAEMRPMLEEIIVDQKITCKRTFKKSETGFSLAYSLGDKDGPSVEKTCKDLISKLPRIFYFDNFLEDQFPDKIDFPPSYFTTPDFVLTEYQSIVEGMFAEAGISLKGFLDELDENTKQTQIAEVNRLTTNTLINEWKIMHVGNTELDIGNTSDLEINLQQDRINTHAININIIEKFVDQEDISRTTSMLLSERSLGFRWFFNFSAKKSYGARGEKRFIYLFDEPGSYLHNGAQNILLKAIKDLSKIHPVIFSTHSEFLLDPEIININNIRIVEKNDRQVKLVPLSEIGEKRTMGALSTLYNALRMKIPISSTLNQKVMITEGITDYYFWKMLTKDIVILPGFGAGQNEYLLSIAIGTSKKHIALFDGDVAGEQALQKYQRFFGLDESKNWYKYKITNGNEVKLENILSSQDQQRLSSITNMVDLKKAITTLFFFSETQKNTFWEGVNDETKNNLKLNIKLFKVSLDLNNTSFNYSLSR